MGIFEYLLGAPDKDDDRSDPPAPKSGRGPDVDAGRHQTKTEKDLRRVQSRHSPERDRFDPGK